MRKTIPLLLLAACAGKAPPNLGNSPDAAVDSAPPAATTQNLSGKAMDFFGGQAVDGVALATDGVDPQQTATSGADGTYTLDLPIGSKLFLVASKTNYRPTRNPSVAMADMPVIQDVYAMTVQDVRNQYTGVGKTPTTGTAFLAVELVKHNGTPLEGIPATGITLLDAANQPVTTGGIYFFNAQGALDTAVTTATAYNGHSRAAILDVAPGSYTLAVTYPAGMGGNMQDNTTVATEADGATYAPSYIATGSGGGGGMGSGGGSGMGSGSATDPTFAADIYPLLQKAGAGGLGCANCHTANGPAAVLPYDDAAQTVLDHMKAIPGVLDLTTPANSMFLTYPLYEPTPPQNHPNATFLDINDPDYKLFLLWITNGAKP
jgi:hypothetical protein